MISHFLVAGGDRRSYLLAELLKKEGFSVNTIGFDEDFPAEAALRRAETVLLPYPHSVQDGRIRMPGKEGFPLKTLLKSFNPGTLIFHHGNTGCYGDDFRWRLYDCDPLFTLQNAQISAEGALFELMKAREKTVYSMRCLVTGYGVFGRALTKLLLGVGARVTVAARREEALSMADLDGAETLYLCRLEETPRVWDAVLNTVPSRILSDTFIASLPKHCILMELASGKGGFDAECAERDGKKVLLLPGIPGRYAPRAAARVLMNSVLSSLKE